MATWAIIPTGLPPSTVENNAATTRERVTAIIFSLFTTVPLNAIANLLDVISCCQHNTTISTAMASCIFIIHKFLTYNRA